MLCDYLKTDLLAVLRLKGDLLLVAIKRKTTINMVA